MTQEHILPGHPGSWVPAKAYQDLQAAYLELRKGLPRVSATHLRIGDAERAEQPDEQLAEHQVAQLGQALRSSLQRYPVGRGTVITCTIAISRPKESA